MMSLRVALLQIIIDNFDCHCMAMLATQWKYVDQLDGLDTTIQHIPKEDVKHPIQWVTPMVQFEGPKMPAVLQSLWQCR